MPGHGVTPRPRLAHHNSTRSYHQRTMARLLFITTTTSTLIVTGGLGTFPPNPLTSHAAQLVGENLPAEIIQPANQILNQVGAPTLPAQATSQHTPENPVATAISSLFEPLFATTAQPTSITTATAASVSSTPTLEPSPSASEPATLTPTVMNTPSGTPTIPASATPSATSLPTWTAVYIPPPPPSPTRTRKPREERPTETATPNLDIPETTNLTETPIP